MNSWERSGRNRNNSNELRPRPRGEVQKGGKEMKPILDACYGGKMFFRIASPALMPMWVPTVLSVSKLTSLSRFLTTLMRSVRLLSINSKANAVLY